jgi:hypothetical protein
MADDLKNKGPQDRTRINLSEDWEMAYWTKELNCSESELRKAITNVGNSTDAVRKYLKR